jgi:hypothetical protein
MHMDGFLGEVMFRLRLLGLALRPMDRIPASVVMALEEPAYDATALLREDQGTALTVR